MIPTLRSSSLLDRQSHKRSDAEYIASVAREDDARFLVLVDHKPVIVSNEARDEAALRWFTAAELERSELERPESMFLGVERDSGAGRFALAFSEHRVKASPAAWAMLRPSVDLRTLAMQGIMSSEELSLAGQAKALAHWHDNARCCGRCGGVTRVKDGGWRRKCWACGTEHVPAHRSRRDHADRASRPAQLPARPLRPFRAEHVFDARRLRRARRGRRRRGAPRGDGGGRRRGRRGARSTRPSPGRFPTR